MIKKLLAALFLIVALPHAYGQTGFCDTTYWNHTYSNGRLKVYDSCRTVTGTIQLLLPPAFTADGDYHIYVQVDTAYAWMLSYRDTAYTKYCEGVDSSGYLVCPACLNVEEVCKGAVVDGGTDGAIENAACVGFSDTVYLPNVGEYVMATGPFVYDTVHCWNELHPISKMVVISPAAVINQPSGGALAEGLKVFPQPANNQVSFEFEHAPQAITLIKLYDMAGYQLYVYALSQTNRLTVDVSSWPGGMYFYSIVSQEQGKTLRSGKFSVVH